VRFLNYFYNTFFEKPALALVYVFGFFCFYARILYFFTRRSLLTILNGYNGTLRADTTVFLRFFMRTIHKSCVISNFRLHNSSIVFCFLVFTDAFYLKASPTLLLSFGIQIFLMGLVGIGFNKRSFISLLLNIEVMFLGVSVVFISFMGNSPDQAYAAAPLLILSVAACETALGLSIIIFMYKHGWQTDNIVFFNAQVAQSNYPASQVISANVNCSNEENSSGTGSPLIKKNFGTTVNFFFFAVFLNLIKEKQEKGGATFLMEVSEYSNLFFF